MTGGLIFKVKAKRNMNYKPNIYINKPTAPGLIVNRTISQIPVRKYTFQRSVWHKPFNPFCACATPVQSVWREYAWSKWLVMWKIDRRTIPKKRSDAVNIFRDEIVVKLCSNIDIKNTSSCNTSISSPYLVLTFNTERFHHFSVTSGSLFYVRSPNMAPVSFPAPLEFYVYRPSFCIWSYSRCNLVSKQSF